ncbi:hypothetical protein pipiens_012615 [Culex pipiens pipiens]|uniref:Uncharacterized protein n=1 Tax=Culex pipiens pipiens TaxID=38569 RepID=A0ABD1D1K1_CULPP
MSDCYTLDGREESNVRTKRGRKPRVSQVDPEPNQNLDSGDSAGDEQPVIPPGFLSPSVQEYLELGKSIPGEIFGALI